MCGCSGGEPPGEAMPIEFKEGDADSQADRALARLPSVAAQFDDPSDSPISRSCIRCGRPATATTTISRACKEWSLTGGDDDGMRCGE